MASTTSTNVVDSVTSTVRPSVPTSPSRLTLTSSSLQISNAASYVTESAQELVSGSSKEANKVRTSSLPRRSPPLADTSSFFPFVLSLQEVAKGNTDASLTDRASAGFNALGDKAQESKQFVSFPFLLLDVVLTSPLPPRSSAKADAHKEAAKN